MSEKIVEDWKPTRIEGYEAAEMIIREVMERHEAMRPSRRVKKTSASYREGYADGLLFGHCMMALGAHPDSNMEPIREALNRKAGAL